MTQIRADELASRVCTPHSTAGCAVAGGGDGATIVGALVVGLLLGRWAWRRRARPRAR